MGFSEFQRLKKHVSSRLGVTFDLDGDVEDPETDSEEEEAPRRRRSSARERWQGSYRKVVLMKRFFAAAKEAEKRDWWAEAYIRKGIYLLAGRLANGPFEVLFTRASLGFPALPPSPFQGLVLDGAPILALQSSVSLAIKAISKGRRLQDGKNQSKDMDWRTNVFDLVLLMCRSLLLHPLDTAFYRKIILGQSLWSSLSSISLRSWNTFTTFFAQESLERLVGLGVDALFDEDMREESVISDVARTGAQFVVSVGLLAVRSNAAVSQPHATHPDAIGFWQGCSDVYYSRGGLGGFFWGIGTMAGLLVPMFGAFMTSQLIVHKLLGKSRRELYEDQVEAVRECLELNRHLPVWVKDREHLETLVEMAAKRKRVLVLVVVSDNVESKHALQAAKLFAEKLQATFLIADTGRMPFLKNLVRDVRIPFLLPVTNQSVDLESTIVFSKERAERVFREIQQIVQAEAS